MDQKTIYKIWAEDKQTHEGFVFATTHKQHFAEKIVEAMQYSVSQKIWWTKEVETF